MRAERPAIHLQRLCCVHMRTRDQRAMQLWRIHGHPISHYRRLPSQVPLNAECAAAMATPSALVPTECSNQIPNVIPRPEISLRHEIIGNVVLISYIANVCQIAKPTGGGTRQQQFFRQAIAEGLFLP